jgi:hypothetical protein
MQLYKCIIAALTVPSWREEKTSVSRRTRLLPRDYRAGSAQDAPVRCDHGPATEHQRRCEQISGRHLAPPAAIASIIRASGEKPGAPTTRRFTEDSATATGSAMGAPWHNGQKRAFCLKHRAHRDPSLHGLIMRSPICAQQIPAPWHGKMTVNRRAATPASFRNHPQAQMRIQLRSDAHGRIDQLSFSRVLPR